MKKVIGTTLLLALLASCSNNIATTSNLNNVDSVNITKITKADNESESMSVKVNVKINSVAPKFAIKSWTSNGNLSRIHLKLHSSPGVDPANRFDSIPLASVGSDKSIPLNASNLFSAGVLTPPGGITFKNLKLNTSYYLSARVYSTNFNNNVGTVSATSGSNSISGSGTSWNTTGQNQLFKGDIITVGTDKYTVTSVESGGTSCTVFPNIVNTFSAQSYTVETNVTGTGSLGGANGMASTTSAIGGGTAVGLNNGSAEEYVQVSSVGTLTIFNDATFNSTSPIGTPTANNSFDMAIQVMKDIDTTPPQAQTPGAINVYQGDTAPPPAVLPEDIQVAP